MINDAYQLIPYIENGATLEDIKKLLCTKPSINVQDNQQISKYNERPVSQDSLDGNEVITDSSYQILSRKADLLRTINRLQEPIPLMKVSDADIIQKLIGDLYSQFMMLTELSNVQTIMTNYQASTKEIIDATNELDEDDPDKYQHLINLIRKYEPKTVDSQLVPKGIGGSIIDTVKVYLNLEGQIMDALKIMEQARRSNPLIPLMSHNDNHFITSESFRAKINEYIDKSKGKFPLTQIQGILQGVRLSFAIAERMRFNSGPFEPINLIELFGVDLIARLIAYARIEAEFLVQEPKE